MGPGLGPRFPFLRAIYLIVRRTSAVHTFELFRTLFSAALLHF
jgi:hypothetical protein